MAQKRILKRDASTGRISEGVSGDTYFSADPAVSSDLTTKNYADTNLAGQPISAPGSSSGQLMIYDAGANQWVPGDPLVQGLFAEGHAIANPVTIGGKDGSGNNKAFAVDASGFGTVNVNGTVPVSGTVAVTNSGTFAVQATLSAETTKVIGTVNQGTSPWVVTGGGGGTQYADNAASGSTPTGTLMSSWDVANSKVRSVVCDANQFPKFNIAASSLTDPAEVVAGTTASSKILIVGGKTNDGTAQYREIPEGAGGRSVIVEGFTGGTAVPVSFTQAALPSHQSVNVDQLNGTTTDTNSGTKSAGTLRVVLATDQPQLTNKLLVTPDANSAINVAQVAGNTTLTGNGVTGTGSQRVTIASDNTAFSVNAHVTGNGGATLDSTVGAATAPANALATSGVFSTTQPAPTNGQAVAVQIDQAANQLMFNGVALKTLSAQSGTLNATQTIFSLSGAESVIVQLTQTTTITAGAVTFEFTYDGTNFSACPANCVVDPTSATFAQIAIPYTCQASTNKVFLILCNGATGLRIRTSTAITGTGSVTPNYALQNFDPLPNVVAFSPTAANFLVTTTPPTHASTNVDQIAGTTPDTNSGTKSAGTLRVVLATDQPALTNKLLVTPDSVALPANQSVNVSQINAVAPLMGNGVTGTGSQRVTIASDNTAFSVNATLSAETTKVIGTTRTLGNTGATLDSTVAAGTAPTNAIATLVQYNTTIPAPTAAQTVSMQGASDGALYVNTEGRKTTYSCFASFTAAAGVIAVLPGSASKTIRVLRAEVSLSTSGTAAIEQIQLIKTSAAPSGGTSAGMTAVPHDSNYAGASAAPLSYTVAPSAGTPVGTIRGVQFSDASSTTPGSNTWLWDWGVRPGTAIVLRGTAQTLEVNLGAAVSSQTATVSFEWTEE